MVICAPCTAHAKATTWRTLAPGLEYAMVSFGSDNMGSFLHAFRVDPQHYRLDVAFASDFGQQSASVRELAERTKARVAINGGFFSPELQPLGLRIQNGKRRTPLKSTSWWGIFSLEGTTPHIAPPWAYRPSSQTRMAVQSGPRLIVDGRVPPLKEGMAERSALCITPEHRIVVAATENAPMSTSTLADLLRRATAEGGFACRDALNLDGGRSTQLYARIGRFRVHVPNLSTVTDAVIVVPK
ncbi:MAG: phosphodiester glycosidase family protein [Deltaproteobacteria bacterium]|nr:phosphodiester glycosidase family protein [Deltaproteobacteria bacterium]